MGLLQGEESELDIDLELDNEPLDDESDETRHVPWGPFPVSNASLQSADR